MSKKDTMRHIESLEENNAHLVSVGHSFWHCAAVDKEKNIQNYYVSINRTVHMSTCSNCGMILTNNRLIKKLKKQLQ
jgi:hypothetical protein